MSGFVAGQSLPAADLNAAFVVKRVRVATTTSGTLASSFEAGDTVDGVTLADGDRILIKDQAAPAANGIYVVAASGAPTRAVDFDSSAEVLPGTTVVVSEGTLNADTSWMLTTNAPIVLDTTGLTFVRVVPRELGYASYDGSQAGIGTSYTDLTSMSASVTVGSRPVIIRGFITAIKTGGAGDIQVIVYDSTAAAQVSSVPYATVPLNAAVTMPFACRVAPAAGSRTYKIRALASVNTMTFVTGHMEIEEANA